MRDPTGPCDLLDERVDDVEGLELLVLPEHVAPREGKDGLGLRNAPTGPRLSARLLVLVVCTNNPVLELFYVPTLGSGERLIIEEEAEVVS